MPVYPGVAVLYPEQAKSAAVCKNPFFTLLRVVGKLVISAYICILFWWFFHLSMLSRSLDSSFHLCVFQMNSY